MAASGGGKEGEIRENEETKKEAEGERGTEGGRGDGATRPELPLPFFSFLRQRRRSKGGRGRGSAGVVPPDLDQGPLFFPPTPDLFWFHLLSLAGEEETSSAVLFFPSLSVFASAFLLKPSRHPACFSFVIFEICQLHINC